MVTEGILKLGLLENASIFYTSLKQNVLKNTSNVTKFWGKWVKMWQQVKSCWSIIQKN
jgi:hypothetical protein